jgi:hypothetical protein
MSYEFIIQPDGRKQIKTFTETHLVSTIDHSTVKTIVCVMDLFADHSTSNFETMVFSARNGKVSSWMDIEEIQSISEEAAIAAHSELVRKYS